MKYLLMGILSLYSLCGYTQVYKFKAFNTYFLLYDSADHVIGKQDSMDVDFLVVVNFDKNKITTYGKQEGTMDLLKCSDVHTDKLGNAWSLYDGVDQFGEKCMVQMVIYKHPIKDGDGTLMYYYEKPNISCVYRLKND